METPVRNVPRWMPIIVFVVAGLMVGVSVGYLMWNPAASNYAVVSTANDATRTVKIHEVTVTFPSVVITKVGTDTSITIVLTNMRRELSYVVVSLALARNSGIDQTTISSLTSNYYTVTLASYASANDILNIKPQGTGYAFFDLMIDGDFAGTIALYVVPS